MIEKLSIHQALSLGYVTLSLFMVSVSSAAGRLSPSLRNRTIKSHMSYDTCKETLLANDLSEVNNIVLIHL